jgi:hypothetical protein
VFDLAENWNEFLICYNLNSSATHVVRNTKIRHGSPPYRKMVKISHVVLLRSASSCLDEAIMGLILDGMKEDKEEMIDIILMT